MRNIKCKYCGKIYASPSEMRKRKCHSHPNGAWGGYCTPDSLDESEWKSEKFYDSLLKHFEDQEEDDRKRKMHEAELVREYKKHTPLLDCMLGKSIVGDEIGDYKLKIRNSDLNQLALDLANGITTRNRDAINTIYALRTGCDYVLNNVDAQKEGSLCAWLGEIKRLKYEVVYWEFWVALYWLTKPFKVKAAAARNDYENDYNNYKYWIENSIATVFHVRQVLPMLRAANKKGDENDKAVMDAVAAHVSELKSEKSKEKGVGLRQLRCIETLCRRINDFSFWSVLYCLYWMKLRPTPWSDQKVWPIQDHNVHILDGW